MPKAKGTAETISIVELLRMFPDQETCIARLERLRWDKKPACAHCGADDRVRPPKSKPHTYWCGHCRRQFTVTTGTIMHATKTPLQNWIVAIYSVMTARKGVSAMQLSKELGVPVPDGVGTCCTASAKRALAARSKLDSVVEIDEVHVGGKEENKHGKNAVEVWGGDEQIGFIGRGEAGVMVWNMARGTK